MPPDPSFHRFKVVFYGDRGVGKTSIVNKYLTGEFHGHVTKPTTEFVCKSLNGWVNSLSGYDDARVDGQGW